MISGTLIPGVSSRYISVLPRTSPASISLIHSSALSLPVLRVVPEISASIERSLEASCSFVISSEKNATLRLHFIATCFAIFSAKLVFPMPGRAASRIRSERFRPVITLSSRPIPVGIPLYSSPSLELSWSSLTKVSRITSFIGCNPPLLLLSCISKILCSAESITFAISSPEVAASSIISRDDMISLLRRYLSLTMLA